MLEDKKSAAMGLVVCGKFMKVKYEFIPIDVSSS